LLPQLKRVRAASNGDGTPENFLQDQVKHVIRRTADAKSPARHAGMVFV
jgi:hypothetical protein